MAKQMIKLEIGKKYKTRGGMIAEVLCDGLDHGEFGVKVTRQCLDETQVSVEAYRIDGAYNFRHKTQWDILEEIK